MFRYSAPGQLDFRVGGTRYFSLDGGDTAVFGNTFSTGRYNGDGNQASHWKDNVGFIDPNAPGCFQSTRQVGIMDPTSSPCYTENVTRNDIAAFDAMGWNLSVNALNYANMTTAQIYQAAVVPEPGTWAMMLAGGLGVDGIARRQRRAASERA